MKRSGPGVRGISRVDIQVSLLTAIVVCLSCGAIFGVNYFLAYHDMIHSLSERVLSLSGILDSGIPQDALHEIEEFEDKDTDIYRECKSFLEFLKNATGVRYLYTAKKNSEGKYIYVVDGLPADSPDFRFPGDEIEVEIIPDLEQALSGESVLPSNILSTSWGHVFVAYLPIHDGSGEVIGVIGVEFDAEHQYRTFLKMRIGTPVVILLACLVAVVCAVFIFRRISNPGYTDLANTDFLTGLRNRNAFETDMQNHNRKSRRSERGIISIDLDGLKAVNDTSGHEAGDRYIRDAVEVLLAEIRPPHVLYRIGGDEFAALTFGISQEEQQVILEKCRARMEQAGQEGKKISFSMGCAMQEEGEQETLFEVLRRADERMYEDKRRRKERTSESGGNSFL